MRNEQMRKSHHKQQHGAHRGPDHLAERETLLIRRLKWAFILVLLFFASAVATYTFVTLSQKQQQNYKDAVRNHQ
jgi:hypothetical protein